MIFPHRRMLASRDLHPRQRRAAAYLRRLRNVITIVDLRNLRENRRKAALRGQRLLLVPVLQILPPTKMEGLLHLPSRLLPERIVIETIAIKTMPDPRTWRDLPGPRKRRERDPDLQLNRVRGLRRRLPLQRRPQLRR